MIEGRYDAWEKEVAQNAAHEATHEARCQVLMEQLEDRFGAQPDTLFTAMRTLDLEALRIAAKRVLHANTVEEVFEGLL